MGAIHKWAEIPTPKYSYRAITEGKHPSLTWEPDSCPVEVGDQIHLVASAALDGESVPSLWISIEGFNPTKTGRVMAQYTVYDFRPLYLSEGSDHLHGHGYTRSPGRSIDPAAPVADPEVYEQIHREQIDARLRRAEARQMKDKDNPKQIAKAINDRLKRTLSEIAPEAQDKLVAGIERLIVSAEEQSNQ